MQCSAVPCSSRAHILTFGPWCVHHTPSSFTISIDDVWCRVRSFTHCTSLSPLYEVDSVLFSDWSVVSSCACRGVVVLGVMMPCSSHIVSLSLLLVPRRIPFFLVGAASSRGAVPWVFLGVVVITRQLDCHDECCCIAVRRPFAVLCGMGIMACTATDRGWSSVAFKLPNVFFVI